MLSLRSLHPLRRLLQISCVAGLVGGCFQEVDPSTTQPTCTAGTRGCECSNGLCGEELMCSPAANVCVLENCQPGTEICECDNGECGPQLECKAGICRLDEGDAGTDSTVSSSTTGSSTMATMSGPSTLTSSTLTSSTTMEDSTTASMSDSTTVVDTTVADTTTTSSTGGAPDCVESHEKNCYECLQCVAGPEQPCETEGATCEGTSMCPQVSVCMTLCAADGGDCFDDCCEGRPPDAVDAAVALFECQTDSCVSQYCARFIVPPCTPD